MKVRINKLLLGFCLVAGVIAFQACSDEWDNHYSNNNKGGAPTAEITVMDALKADPRFSAFTDSIIKYGYDKILQSNRAFTIFAPTNEALQALVSSGKYSTIESLIKNHIAYFTRSVNDFSDTTVTMMNKKVMRVQNGKFGDKQNPTVSIIDSNIPCSNGVIHLIDGVAPYIPNLWELIAAEGPAYSEYLHRKDRKVLNVNESTLDSIDKEGTAVFLDSVVVYHNEYWNYLGQLNEEDSAYVSLVLTDNAYADAEAKIGARFNYYPDIQWAGFYTKENTKANKDSLINFQSRVIHETIIGSLSFRLSAIEQLLAGTYRPDYPFINSMAGLRIHKTTLLNILQNTPTEKIQSASNGKAYILDSYDIPSYEVLPGDTLLLEAERTPNILRLANPNMTTQVVRMSNAQRVLYDYSQDAAVKASIEAAGLELYQPKVDPQTGIVEQHRLSGAQFLTVGSAPTSAAGLTYGLPNTFSGTYDVWVTFFPAAKVPNMETVKPSEVMLQVKHSRVSGTNITNTTIRTNAFQIDPYAITKVKIANNVNFDPAWYAFMTNEPALYTDPADVTNTDLFGKQYGLNVQFTNRTAMSNNTTDHNLYIDCIELIPHRD